MAIPSLVDELYAVGRGLPVVTGNELILDLLAFVQGPDAGALQGGNMNKYVLAAVGGLDEAIAFAGVKPLYGSYRHSLLQSVDIDLAVPDLGLSRECENISW
jgi:hypothetical protein